MKKDSFFIKDFYYIKSDEEIDLSFIPLLLRRKLSNLDKAAIFTMNKVYSDDVKEIVFASQYGESDRLNTIISQYQEFNEVSPAQFSGSVHNYPCGFFCLLKKLNIPYYALSAGDETFKNGIIKAVLSYNDNVLFTYTDNISISCIISKTGGIELNLNSINSDIQSFINLLEGAK